MKRDIEHLLKQARVNGYASQYFQTYYEAHKTNNLIAYYMKQDKDYDWSNYTVSVTSQFNSHYRLTVQEGNPSKDENKYEWVIRNLTLHQLLYRTVYPKELNVEEKRSWVLQACEEVLDEKVRIVIRKGKYCLIADLERLGKDDEIQSEIIFQNQNG